MWNVTIRYPDGAPKEYTLQAGINTLGRLAESDICIEDISASRKHAEIEYNPVADVVKIRDLNSSNGTYINRHLIQDPVQLFAGDIIRIGNCVISLTKITKTETSAQSAPSLRRHTRELLLESLDQHTVLIYDVARRLNIVLDTSTALQEIAGLMKQAMGADRCEVILANQFEKLGEMGFPVSIAQKVIDEHVAVLIPDMSVYPDRIMSKTALLYQIRSVLCIPIISQDSLLGLIYMYKFDPMTYPFQQSDLQLAVAISHQAALTLQRAALLDTVRHEQAIQSLLQRLLAPQEAKAVLDQYLTYGTLPELKEQSLSVLFVDIADSTGIAERIGTSQFGAMLECFYADWTSTVFEHSGLIKLLGDGMMAVFTQATSTQMIHSERAIRAGLKLLEHNRTPGFYECVGDLKIKIGIGVTSGVAAAGYVGNPMRMEYTVLGDIVNIAARLQYYARPNRLVTSPATMAEVTGKFITQRLGEINVRGRQKSIQAYEVLGLAEDQNISPEESILQSR
ncbi:MAG: FHA domain-containing protein [Anaerolineales bacterium]|nr:FHA domain-containing protein [Anaerolineales bacterium]